MSDVRQCDHCKRVASIDDKCWLQLGRPPQPKTMVGYMYSEPPKWTHLCSWVCVMDYANLYVLDPSPREAA